MLKLPLLLFATMGVGEWVIILAIVLLLFGGRKIPGLMRGLGTGIRDFKDAVNKKEEKEKQEEKTE